MIDKHLIDHVVNAMLRADKDPYREATIMADASDHVDGHTDTAADATRIWLAACAEYDAMKALKDADDDR